MEKFVLPILGHDRADPDQNEDGDSHHVKEAAASKQKPSASTRITMMKKNTEDDDIHACFKKLETVEEDVAR
ncbi:hypothetical protein Tco_1333695, partial [Tanacetum coccineum]